jgi:hypothetical protein
MSFISYIHPYCLLLSAQSCYILGSNVSNNTQTIYILRRNKIGKIKKGTKSEKKVSPEHKSYLANWLRKFGTNGHLNILKSKVVFSLSRINLRRSASLHIMQAASTHISNMEWWQDSLCKVKSGGCVKKRLWRI